MKIKTTNMGEVKTYFMFVLTLYRLGIANDKDYYTAQGIYDASSERFYDFVRDQASAREETENWD